ncbi:hypothetical protein [Streptomyces sp. NPDC046942]|uniref:hypothetical protein n=1 Tax=Streptomyces sp. NPDC046942 TaxID=3155137 RepID=UPI0033E88219
MSDGGGSDLRRGADALSKFADGLNHALTVFEKSAGSRPRLEDQKLAPQSFSGANIAFSEAEDLRGTYDDVHNRLVSMSQTLSLHIEALHLAAKSADVTYDGTEDEVRRRFWEIKSELDDEYHKTHPKPGHPQKQEQPPTDKRQHTTGNSAGGNYQ